MDDNMNPMENNSISDNSNSVEQQSQSEEAESSVRPSLSQVRKSWGFRRTTIARREFLDEVGELAHSSPPERKVRTRRTNPTTMSVPESFPQRATPSARSALDDLEWSAPSSPASEESKPASDAPAGGCFDPSLWQDFGSAFHTAFSLLGGNEDMSLEMSDALEVPDILQATDTIEVPPPQAADETEMPDSLESTDDMEILPPDSPGSVAGGDIDDVVLISSQEGDSDELTLLQVKEQQASKGGQGNKRTRGGKGGRGKARGRGRGRRKGRGRGRGRGKVMDLQSSIADDEDSNDDVIPVNPSEQQQQLQEEEKANDPHGPPETGTSAAHCEMSPAQRSSSDFINIEPDLDQSGDATTGQYDDAPEELEQEEDVKEIINEGEDPINEGEYSDTSNVKLYDSNSLHCICQQKHTESFMIRCDHCQKWLHGSCVGISETERCGQEYICPPCTAEMQSQLQPDPQSQSETEPSIPECSNLNVSGEEGVGHEDQPAVKETAFAVEGEEEKGSTVTKPEPEAEMEMDTSLSLCIGPSCPKQALPDSVYCGSDCILQHAAFTMKTLSVPKVPKSKGQAQRKAATPRPAAKGKRPVRTSKRLSRKAAEEAGEKEVREDDGGQKEAAVPVACDPSLTEAQATPLPSPKFYTASITDSELECDIEDPTPSKQSPEDTSTDALSSPQPVAEPDLPQSQSQEKLKEPTQQQPAETNPCASPNSEIPSQAAATQSPSTSAPRHHETGALMVTKTTYVIPKKQPVPQPPSGQVSASVSCQKPPPAPTHLSETRNLLVPPAPSAPSSRPSQPNNQVRQSIQRSLTSIVFKRVCDCEDLEMSESDVVKLVASIEKEMFDIFRNTDSKYMNKYRTIMFNLKDPKNKGLLCRVVHGEIGPFRLVRMSQKDMQATKASEPSAKETIECKDTAAKGTSLQQKPEPVKVDLPSLNPAKPETIMEQKKSLPAPAPKIRTRQIGQISAPPDILTCMLKDTTSEHKAHLFDLKCKICTGQMLPGDQEEPAKKRPRVSETRDSYESSRRRSARDDSPLRAPPDSPDMDFPSSSSLMDTSSHLTIDSPVLTIVESPASPIMDSPASPILESPASPVMESPSTPTQDAPKATDSKRAYRPVVIPAVSTVTITRRDPRTAASRSSAQSSNTSAHSNTTFNQSVPYAPLKEMRLAPPSAAVCTLPPTKPLPKSILMKPSHSANPRLYGTSSRTMSSESPADDETSHFLAKQDILWKGFLNMLTVSKFVTKGYLVSGSAENLKADLPDTIQIGGRILPETVWDYVAKLKTSVTKELCVVRFHPATEEEEVAYVSLFSYFSSRGRFGVVANSSRSIKDLYLVPLSAQESIPSILQPLEGPGLEKRRPNILLGLAIVQKVKRPGSLPQEIEENRPRVHMSKDPMWIPKPPVLYGSDKLEIFQPYDPETPANTTPPSSPSFPGSPSESSSSDSIPSLLNSIRAKTPFSTSAAVSDTQSTSKSISDRNPTTTPSDSMPLQTILKSLFGHKKTEPIASSDRSSTTSTVGVKRHPGFPKVSGPMVDPIVQQYGQKSKVRKIEEENDLDRPYDPEDEYDPAVGYGMVAPQITEKTKADGPAVSGLDDDVAYDPEDETIFADIQSDVVTKPLVPPEMSESSSCPTSISNQAIMPASTSNPVQAPSPAGVMPNLPTGTVVVSAATLTEQQRMLEELNKQIEEQKQQLKVQEEALRQQREAVGMFMAHFTVSDSMMSSPQKSLPLSQLSSLQSGVLQTESGASDETKNPRNTVDSSNVDSQAVKQEDTTAIPNLKDDEAPITEQDETQENVKEVEKYSSAGEIEDSDIAYDPEDESLFDEIQEDVFKGGSEKTRDSSLSRTGHSTGRKDTPHRSRKRRLSPRRRSHRERDRNRSPSSKSQRRSPSHSRRRRERERHRRSERDRSRHRAKDQSERQGRHRKDHTARRHSHGQRRSPSPRKNDSVSLSPKQLRRPSPKIFDSSSITVTIKNDPEEHQLNWNHSDSPEKDCSSHELLPNVKLEISDVQVSQELQKSAVGVQEDTSRASSTQVDNPPQQETLLNDKLQSTVRLREIEPPIRDSPQSPDPEPQFAKPSSIENSDYEMIDIIRGPETSTSVSMPLDKVQNNYPPIGCQTTMCNMSSTIGGSLMNLRTLDFISLDLQGPGVRDQEPYKRDMETGVQGSETNMSKAGTQHHSTDRIGWEPVMKGSGMSSPSQHMESSCMQGVNPEVRNQGPDVKGSDPEMRGQMIVPAVMTSLMGVSGLQNEISDSIMKGPLLDQPGPDRTGDQSFRGPLVEHRASDITGRVRGQNDRSESPHTRGMKRDGGVRDPSPGIRSPHPGSARVQHQDGSLVVDERGFQKRDFQPHGRDADLNTDGVSREISLDSNTSAGSEGAVLRTGRLYHAVSDERQEPQRATAVPMPGPNINNKTGESNMSFIGQDNSGPGEHLNEPQLAINVQRSDHCPDKRNIINPNWRVPGTGLVHPDTREQMSQNNDQGSHAMGPHWSRPGLDTEDNWRGSGRRGPNTEDLRNDRRRSRGRDFMAPGPERRGSDMEVPMHDRRRPGGPDFRGPEPARGGPTPDSQGPCLRGPGARDFMGPGLERKVIPIEGLNQRRPAGPDFRGPWSERRGPDMEVYGNDKQRPECPDFSEPGHERRGLSMTGPWPTRREPGGPDFRGPRPAMRGPGGPDFRGPRPESRALSMEDPGRGPGGPDERESVSENIELSMDGTGPLRRGSRGPDFSGPGPDSGCLAMAGPGPDRRVHGGPDISGPGPDRRSPAMADLGPDRRVHGGPDFSGPRPDRRGPAMAGPGPDRRVHVGPDFSGPGPNRRGPAMAGPGPDSRVHGGPDFSGPGPDRRGPAMAGPGPDSRVHGGPDFSGPVPDRRGPAMAGPGPDRRVHVGPDFSGPGPDRIGPAMAGPGPDSRVHGGPDFSGPVPDRRGPAMAGPGPDRREHGGSDYREPGPDRRGLVLGGPGPDRRETGGSDFRGQGLERRGPIINDLGTGRSRPGGPNFSGPGPNRRGHTMGGPGPERRESEFSDFNGPEYERNVCTIDSHEPNKRGLGGPNFHGKGPERGGLVMDGPGPDKRGPGGPDLRGPGCDWRGSSMQGKGPDRRGLGDQNTGGIGPDKRGPYMRGPGPDFIEPGPEQTGPDMEGQEHQTRGQHLRGSMRESDYQNMEGPENRGPRPERPDFGMEGPGFNRRGPRGPNMRPVLQYSGPNIEGPIHRRRGPVGPNFRGPAPPRRPPEMEEMGNSRGLPGGPQFRGPVPERRPPAIEGSESDRKGPHFKGERPERTFIDCPGADSQGPNEPDFTGPDCESSGPDNFGPGTDWRRPGRPGPGIRPKGPNIDHPGHRRDTWGGDDFGGSESIQESLDTDWPGPNRTAQNFRGRGPVRRNIRGSGPDLSNLNPVDSWKEPDFRDPAPDRGGPQPVDEWSDGRGQIMEAAGNERDHSGNYYQEGPDEQVQEHSGQGPPMEWRGRGGPKPIHERPRRQFPVPLKGRGVNLSGFHRRGPGPVRNDPDMVEPRPSREGSGKEWSEPDMGDAGHRCGPGQFGQKHYARGRGMTVLESDMTGGPGIKNKWKGPDVRGMGGPNMEGPGAHRVDPELMNKYPKRRRFEMEDFDRGGPRGLESSFSGPENRNSVIERPVTDEIFSDFGERGSEMRDVDMESPGTDRQGFHDFSRERRGPGMRRLRPDKTDMRDLASESLVTRHGPGRRAKNIDGPGFGSPHQGVRFQSPNDPQTASCSGPPVPAQISGRNSCPGIDNLKNQQEVTPQRSRGGLLPTPTQGLIRFPNQTINNPDVFIRRKRKKP